LGIPDLRTFAPPYLSLEEDWNHTEALAARFDELDFEGLLRFKYKALYPHYDANYRRQEIDARLERFALAEQRVRIVRDVIGTLGLDLPTGLLLDIGCGTGPFCVAVAPLVERVVGIDITMEELVLARKRLEEAQVGNARLVAACAEKLPFAPGSFALAHGMDLIEHVKDQVRTVREAMRVLDPSGVFSFNSLNRLDLRHPEPHVDLRFVGFWPRPLQEPYVRLLTGKPYKDKRVLSLPELRAVLHRSLDPGHDYRIAHWYLLDPSGEGSSWLGRSLRRLPGLVALINRLWGLFTHQHEVLVWKKKRGHTQEAHIVPTSYGV
jgi:ubiquinone/menaquinone biosynthesis C-methylase UbiE